MSVALGPWVTPAPVLDDDIELPVVVVIDDPDVVVIDPVVDIEPVVDVILEPVELLPDPPDPSVESSQPAAPTATEVTATAINHLMRLFMSLSLSRHEQRDRRPYLERTRVRNGYPAPRRASRGRGVTQRKPARRAGQNEFASVLQLLSSLCVMQYPVAQFLYAVSGDPQVCWQTGP